MPLDPEDDAWMNGDLRWAERARRAEARVAELEIESDYFKQKSSDWHGGLQEAMERIAELEALLPRIAGLRDSYWKAQTDCDLGCCFDPLIERLSKDAKNLTR